MKIHNLYIGGILMASLAIQPVHAQLIKLGEQENPKNQTIKHLKNYYKAFTKHLTCAFKGGCSTEERARIKKAAWALLIIMAVVLSRRFHRKPSRKEISAAGETATEAIKKYQEALTALEGLPNYKTLLEKNPIFKKDIETATKAANLGLYRDALLWLQIARGKALK